MLANHPSNQGLVAIRRFEKGAGPQSTLYRRAINNSFDERNGTEMFNSRHEVRISLHLLGLVSSWRESSI